MRITYIVVFLLSLFVLQSICVVSIEKVQAEEERLQAEAGIFDPGLKPSELERIKAKHITAGGYHSMILTKEGKLYGWGLLGGSALESPREYRLPEGEVEQISSGSYHVLAVSDKGQVFSWGREGALGYPLDSERPEPEEESTFEGHQATPRLVEGLSNIRHVAAGYQHSIAVEANGTAWWWGKWVNPKGEKVSSVLPVKVSGMPNEPIKKVCNGGHHTAFLSEDGLLWVAGANSFGQLGVGTDADLPQEEGVAVVQLKSLADKVISSIACGGDHLLALTDDNTLFGWGWNEYGQVGDISGKGEEQLIEIINTPVELTLPEGVKPTAIFAGDYAHSLFVTEDKELYTWGWNENGQLGLGHKKTVHSPTLVKATSGADIVAADGGFTHSIALAEDGSIFQCGSNQWNQVASSPFTPEGSIIIEDKGVTKEKEQILMLA